MQSNYTIVEPTVIDEELIEKALQQQSNVNNISVEFANQLTSKKEIKDRSEVTWLQLEYKSKQDK
jgi:hypothetical protein